MFHSITQLHYHSFPTPEDLMLVYPSSELKLLSYYEVISLLLDIGLPLI